VTDVVADRSAELIENRMLVGADPLPSPERSRRVGWRVAALALVAIVLVVAIALRRDTISSAVAEIGNLPPGIVVALLFLAIYERWSRGDIVRSLLGEVSLRRAVTIHDVGTAVSKGVPMGGALGTAVRWTIARDAEVGTPRFATMLIGYGVATTFVSWLLPLVALSIDLGGRAPQPIDVALLAGLAAVVVGMIVFWSLILRSDRIESWGTTRLRGLWTRLAGRFPVASAHDPADGVAEVRAELRGLARRPWTLLARTALAQACGAVLLLVALRGLGVGDELGVTEFFRVFFIAHLLGTFAPTPGGVGVVEAGMTGALVAAGVDAPVALAAVLVYRFLTYVLPILFGAGLYLLWSARRARAVAAGGAAEVVAGSGRFVPQTTSR
jgi:uncharacterized membrane protein YbhN (UPF0104 family)